MTEIDQLLETRRIVEAEIEEHIRRKAEEFGGTRLGFFNNFWTTLHDNGEDTFTNLRRLYVTLGTYQKTYRNQLAGSTHGYSQRFLDQTPDEFFRDIDQAMAEEGISGSRIWELTLMMEFPEHVLEELYELQLPVYVRLRAMGYGHHDLIV